MEELLRSYSYDFAKKHDVVPLYNGDFDGIPNDEVNNFLNDIENYPHAFILACTIDYCVDANIAWSIPYQIMKALGGDFSIEKLASFSERKYEALFSDLRPGHRFVNQSARVFYRAVQRIKDCYDGDASVMWKEKSVELFIKEFKSFYHVGQKISNMAANLLYTNLGVKFTDLCNIDIAVDRHVKRVFERTGLVEQNAGKNAIIQRAREINPEYPGILDLPVFNLGRNICQNYNPLCNECPLSERCPRNI